MFKIYITEKGGKKRSVDIANNTAVFGREQGNDVVLQVGNVSKKHCRIKMDNKKFFIEDLGSTNGTYINGRKITELSIVDPGDKIYVGEFIVELESTNDDADSIVEQAPPIPAPKPKVKKSVPPPPLPKPKAVLSPQEPAKTVTATGSFSSLSKEAEASLPEVKSDPSLFKKAKISNIPPPPKPGKEDSQVNIVPKSVPGKEIPYLEQLLDFAALEVPAVNRTSLPSKLNVEDAAMVRLVLSGMVKELLFENKISSDDNPGELIETAFFQIVDTGVLGELIADSEILEIVIGNSESITVRRKNGFSKHSKNVESVLDLEENIRLIGAGHAGSTKIKEDDISVYRLANGVIVLAQLPPYSSGPVVRIIKDISKTDTASDKGLPHLLNDFLKGAKIAVCGTDFTARLAITEELLMTISPDDFAVCVEEYPLIKIDGRNITTLYGNNGISNLLNDACKFAPKWMFARAVSWKDIPSIIGISSSRDHFAAEIPLKNSDSFREDFALGMLSSGMVITKEQAGDILGASFDLIVFTTIDDNCTVKIDKILKSVSDGDGYTFKTIHS
ncbi:MAG: FHA domain-containing protein [Deltaproteobacteria bacterium]|nr:FHA domain-containing protein [Deltaproteobacteria bacterium]